MTMLTRRSAMKGAAAASLAALLIKPEGFVARAATTRNLLKDKRPILHAPGSAFGCYDPYGDFSAESGIATEHLFLPWEDVELGGLGDAETYARARRRNIMITIEPWSWSQNAPIPPDRLRDLILSGQRDANMRAILQAVAGFKSPLIIRWAQEMDNPTGRFTWASWAPQDYIAAFRRMAGIVRETLPHARMMWAPKGEKTLQAFYPGGDAVDVVGLSVFGLEAYDKIAYGKPRGFAETLKQGYDLTARFGKPIWVAELGYSGGLDYVGRWVQEATLAYRQFPALQEVVYFNAPDVWAWPYGLGLPNWRVVQQEAKSTSL